MSRKFQAFLLICLSIFFTVSLGNNFVLAADKETQFQKALSDGEQKISEGKFGEALIEFKKSLKIKPDDADANYKAGVAYYFLRDYKSAVVSYKKAIKSNPKHFKAFNNLGMTYEKQNNLTEATRMYQQAVQVDPQYKKAMYNLGRVLYKRNLLVHAEMVAKELIKAYPEDEEGCYLMGLIYEHNDNYQKAGEMYSIASKLPILTK
jgi:tetratricopeptide (TPR) repeat protein